MIFLIQTDFNINGPVYREVLKCQLDESVREMFSVFLTANRIFNTYLPNVKVSFTPQLHFYSYFQFDCVGLRVGTYTNSKKNIYFSKQYKTNNITPS